MYSKNRQRQILMAIIIFIAILNIFFLQSSAKQSFKADYIALRQEPNQDNPILHLIDKKTPIVIANKEKEWTKIYADNQIGWVLNSDLNSENLNASNTATSVSPTQDNTKIFKDIRSTDKEIGQLNKQDTYLKYFEKNEWSQIVYNNQLAWVETSSIKPISTNPTVETAQEVNTYPPRQMLKVKTATSLLTNPGYGSSLEILEIGESLFIEDKTLYNGYYSATSLYGITGYINAENVDYIEAMTQRTGLKHKSLEDAIIVLDAGHGGEDGGAVSKSEKIIEKNVALQTVETVKTALENEGATVYLTRTDDKDVSLEERTEYTNKKEADLFISLHYDSSEENTGLSGTSTHYLFYEDTRLADLLESHLQLLPLKSNGTKLSNFQVIRDSKSPAVLLELGYMNNDKDVEIFNTQTYRNNVAKAIVDALKQYFSE